MTHYVVYLYRNTVYYATTKQVSNEKGGAAGCQVVFTAGYFNMTALKLHGKEETGTQQFWVGLSHFLPSG